MNKDEVTNIWDTVELELTHLNDLLLEAKIHADAIYSGQWGGEAKDLKSSVQTLHEIYETAAEVTQNLFDLIEEFENVDTL